ncbi:MAG: hypothetical protein A4E25_01080 [Methanobacterium sp. PtaB.Bin024]|jgi:hypothetical protein|nr:MAG: hypothetical protein A4E25_01080 [Methanobacterium sp. PtaB.Bin024]
MKKESPWKIIPTIGLIFIIVIISGCTTPEKNYENDLISFTVPENWSVDKTKFSDELASLRPVHANYPIIYIHSTDLQPAEIIDGYIDNYPTEYPRFQVVTREPVKVNGIEGEKLLFKNTGQGDVLLIGPDFYSVVVVFEENNQTYIITSTESMEHTYYSQVEPALNVLLNSIKIK